MGNYGCAISEHTIAWIRTSMSAELEAAPKALQVPKGGLKSGYYFAKDGTVVLDFTIGGEGLALGARDKAEKSHPIVRLRFNRLDGSCTARVCPAAIPGLKAQGPGRMDAESRERAEEWCENIRKVLRKANIWEFKVEVGMLRDSSFRPAKCPHGLKNQGEVGCQTAVVTR